jgi:predicted GIY-YIG superfamily endonuclease
MPFEALAKKGWSMYYVYLLESEAEPGRRYVGLSSDLKRALTITMRGSLHTRPNTSLGA